VTLLCPCSCSIIIPRPHKFTHFPYTTLFRSSPEQNMLYELILKSGYLLTDKVKKYEIVDEGLDEKMHIKTSFYIVADGELIIARSEEHTSELQSRENLVCRLLLEKKKNNMNI